jgi:hypothetical protein
VTKYGELIGVPTDKRSDKKTITAQLRGRYAALRGLLVDIDGMMHTVRAGGDAQEAMVAGYFDNRRIGGHPGDGEDPEPTTPTPPSP